MHGLKRGALNEPTNRSQMWTSLRLKAWHKWGQPCPPGTRVHKHLGWGQFEQPASSGGSVSERTNGPVISSVWVGVRTYMYHVEYQLNTPSGG